MLKAVAFDLDDTIYPEREFVFGGYRAVGDWTRRKWGVDIYGDLKQLFEQGRRGDLFTPVLRAHGVAFDELELPALVQVYRAHRPILRPFPEVRDILVCLRERGLRLGLISDGYWQVQRNKWRALNLTEYFDAVVFSDEWGRAAWKPDARPYRELAARLDVALSDMAYVGDNPHKDFIGARALGMHTVRVRRPIGLHVAVRLDNTHEADFEIADLTGLPDLFAKYSPPPPISLRVRLNDSNARKRG